MDYSLYALRVGQAKDVAEAAAEYLGHDKAPQSIRIATNTPISNQGWASDAIGCLLRLDEKGALIGAEEPKDTPRLLIPWSNIAYLADGLEEV